MGSLGNAAPLHYVESVDGDLDVSIRNSSNPILFELGTNTITGTMSASFMPSGNDNDDFFFSVPATALLSAITFEITSLTLVGDPVDALVDPEVLVPNHVPLNAIFPVPFPTIVSRHQPISTPATFDFAGALPLAEGVYRLKTSTSIGIDCSHGCPSDSAGFSIHYEYSFTVVPEPSSSVLLALGLVGLARLHRRR